jgi:glycosyltransferase involved in cell wall biosynthesis
VGDGPQREALEALARQLAIAGRVRFTGNQADVAPWMRAFDLFCLPSYANEGVPQALMQAMACGLPVVTTPVGSIEEIVSDGMTGRLVAPQDADALRTAIEALLADGDLRQRLGTRARDEALQRFGEERMVERMLDVFTVATRTSHG